MKPFRRSRDYDGKFALTTLQNPFLDVTPRPQPKPPETKRVEAPAQPLVELNVTATPIEVLDPAPAITPAPEFTDQPQAETRPESAQPSTEAGASASAPETTTPVPETPVIKTERRTAPSTNKKARAKSERTITPASFLPKPDETELERHSRKCAICNHPFRQALEEDFMNWGDVGHITKIFEIKDTRGVYRHAHATGLFERRRQNVRFAAECIVEQIGRVKVSNPESILNAIRTITRLNDKGQWHEPVSHVVVSSGRHINDQQNPNSAEPQNSNRQFSDHLARLETGSK